MEAGIVASFMLTNYTDSCGETNKEHHRYHISICKYDPYLFTRELHRGGNRKF